MLNNEFLEAYEDLEVLENIDLSLNDFIYQLTAYEKDGFVDYEKGLIEIVFNSYLDDASDSDVMSKYNEYLEENNYYDDRWEYNDEEFFNVYFNNNPMEVARAVFYGDYRYNDEYVRFDAYGNLESADEWQILDEIKNDSDFAKWCIYNDSEFDDLMDDEVIEEITNEVLKLVKAGY